MVLSKTELSKDFTAGYEVPLSTARAPYYRHINPNRPIWRNYYIPLMMRDPRLRFGIEVLKGRIIQSVEIEINSYDSEAGDVIQRTWDRFWENAASTVLNDMFVYGYCGQEAMYAKSEEDGEWEYDYMKYISPYDCNPVEREGRLIGMNVRNTGYENANGPQFVPIPKCFWAVHEPNINKWMGRTRLFGAFEPWWEKWCYRGARDLRANWFYRCAFRGPKIGYPPGATPVQYGSTGNVIKKIPNRDIAAQIADDYQAGGSICYPLGTEGQQWLIEDAEVLNVPEGLAVYLDNLDQELLEGLGIPPEILISDGTGAYAGRQVPQEAFISVLEEPAKTLKNAVCVGLFDPLLYMRYKKRVRYDVKIKGLVETLPTASDGMYPSDVMDHEASVEEGTAGVPGEQPTNPISNSPQLNKKRKQNGTP